MRFAIPTILLIAALAACTETRLDKTDPTLDLGRDDYRSLREGGREPAPPIPRLRLRTGEDGKEPLLNSKLVSISVTEKAPLKDVLQELARKANVNLELDPRISGGVIFTASRQPFSRVLDRLCNMAGLRYNVEDGFLRVELDEPYLKTYALDYLTQVRKANGEIGIATNVFSTVQGQNGQPATTATQDTASGNNSLTKVQNEAVADFWKEVESNIDTLLANSRGARTLRTGGEETHTAPREEGLSAGKPYGINRQAGLLTVLGTGRQHRLVESYIERLRRNVNAQVLIEARIVEVELNEGYRSGINWRSLTSGTLNAAARFGTAAAGAPFTSATTATDGLVTLSLNDSDFGGILNFVRSFGVTRTLSSPRLTVLNNQPAILKVARNEVYFTSTVETTPIIGSNGGSPVAVQRTVNSTPNTVPVGFVMTVQPAINLEKDDVTLNMRPTVSFIVDRVEDPGVKIAAADANVPEVSSSIPVVAVREMDSVLTLPSGSVAVMGGLMQDSAGNLENGVPFLDETPVFGNLAKSRKDDSKLTELVILLRATIVDGAPAPDGADSELYKKFSRDRRPLPIHYEPRDAMPEEAAEDASDAESNETMREADEQDAARGATSVGTGAAKAKKPGHTSKTQPKPKKRKKHA